MFALPGAFPMHIFPDAYLKRPPRGVDATAPGWRRSHSGVDLGAESGEHYLLEIITRNTPQKKKLLSRRRIGAALLS